MRSSVSIRNSDLLLILKQNEFILLAKNVSLISKQITQSLLFVQYSWQFQNGWGDFDHT